LVTLSPITLHNNLIYRFNLIPETHSLATKINSLNLFLDSLSSKG
jgi:hypothetical protein